LYYSPQPSPHSAINDFEIRLIVAGSRYYNDYERFSKRMFEFVKKFGDKSIIFISGKARTGADDMIIRWCIEHRLPWAEFPADWDIGKSAGYVRNMKMNKVATDLITFWDSKSRGTWNMIDIFNKAHGEEHVTVVLIDVEE